jgi:hypothetical protein
VTVATTITNKPLIAICPPSHEMTASAVPSDANSRLHRRQGADGYPTPG